jgi:alpha-methylacyl-CoA racemase
MATADQRGIEGSEGPLKGFRIIEMEGVGPGPFAAMWLADMGATVIRVNRPGQRYNQTRGDVLNRSRQSIAVDLKKPGASDVVLRLIERSDALIEGFRPGVMERLGLGPEICLARRPALVYGRVTGWGQEGIYAQTAGHDINYISLTGLLHGMGPADGRPVAPLNLIGDFGGGGMFLVAGMLAALLEASRSGRGQVVDAAMADGASLLGAMIWAYYGKGSWKDQRESNLFDGGAPFYGTYRCKDGGYVALGNIEAEFWDAMLEHARVESDPVLAVRDERARWPEVRARLAEIFLTRTRDEWCACLEGTDACVTPVLTMSEAPRHAFARDRGAFVEVAGVTQPAPAPRFARTPGSIKSPPPVVGEHSRTLLEAHGFGAREIEQLIATGVVQQAEALS